MVPNKHVLSLTCDQMLRNARKTGKSEDWSIFKCVKNKVSNLINQAKKNYLKTQLSENRFNPKNLRNLIKSLTKEDANKQCGIRQLKEHNTIYTEKYQIAEIFNTFFITEPQRLLSSLVGNFSSVFENWAQESYSTSLKIKSPLLIQMKF